jgi:hypothetical protein
MQIKQKIIFIISAGHSGSTLLDLLIGTLPSVLSTGELIWLPWQTWRDGKKCNATPKQDICTCLKTFRECPVWGKVLKNLSGESGRDILKDPLSFNISFLRHKEYTSDTSYKYRILRKLMSISILYHQKWITDSILTSQKESIDNTLMLYDNITKTLKISFIVDSSKDILRAYAVWKKRPNDVKIILLYKDAKSYAASGKHWGAQISMDNRLKQWLHAYQSHFVPILHKMKGCEIFPIKYNEIAQQPDIVRFRLANFIGAPIENNDKWQINTKMVHLVAGNPMRFKGQIDIKYDDRWQRELNLYEQRLAENYEDKMKFLVNAFMNESNTQNVKVN